MTREHLALIEQRLDILMSGLRPLPPVLQTYSTNSIEAALHSTARDAIPINRFEVTEVKRHQWTIKFSIPDRDFSLRLGYDRRKNEFRVDDYTCAKLEDAAMHMMEYVEKQGIVQALRTTAPTLASYGAHTRLIRRPHAPHMHGVLTRPAPYAREG